MSKPDETPPCSKHPAAPHGYDRTSSHSLGRYVCDCEGWLPDETDRLIEAAPDLLAALEFCVEQIENDSMQGWGVGAPSANFFEALERAQAAIQKARGQ